MCKNTEAFIGKEGEKMANIKRKEARELLFGLLFETEFNSDKNAVYERSTENREIPDNAYIKNCYFGIDENSLLLDGVIGNYARGWKADRLSKVSRTVIRLAVYEILFCKDIPANVSVSEAVELAKKYGEDKARAFVNGVLSSIVKDVNENGVDAVVNKAREALVSDVKEETAEAVEETEAEETETEETAENASSEINE